MKRSAKANRKATKDGKVAVKSLHHEDATRKNLPTIENESFVPNEVKAGAAVQYPRMSALMYPRNPDADPQLVWRGKDIEDIAGDLALKALPIYVHEHMTPLHIIQALMDDSQGRSQQPELFERDFNGLTEEQRLKFYEYDSHWQNRMILGDSLAVMASLAEKEGLRGQVQTVYMDPPYGVNFRSNWQVATNKRDVKDGAAESISTDPEQVKAYRDTWKDGVHSYLSYLRDRLTAARGLLSERGSLFVQISEEHVHFVRALLDEVFGSANNAGTIVFFKTSGLGSTRMPRRNDYLLWYAKEIKAVKYHPLYLGKELEGEGASAYRNVLLPDGTTRRITTDELKNPDSLPQGARVFRFGDLTKPGPGRRYTVTFGGKEYNPGNRWWGYPEIGMQRLIAARRVAAQGQSLSYIRFLDDFPERELANVWDDTATGSGLDKIYVVQTTPKVIERCILMTTDPGDLVLDPTCGSGTTAYCAEKWGRRWITTDTSRVALMLARQRIMSSIYPYYFLADSQEGRLQEARASGQPIPADAVSAKGDVAKGFVYERAVRISPETFASNPEIAEGMDPSTLDAAVKRHATTVFFVDRPLVDRKIVRVSGPFTVESLAPGEAQPLDSYVDGSANTEQSNFVELVLDNIRTSGIGNGEKGGRTRFTSVDPFPGEYVDALGITDDRQRVALAVGPKEGTIGKGFMIDAGREALDKCAADLLAVCGFAFEDAAHAERIGSLLVLRVRMNQDLQLGELLKKSKTANLFQVYGEPDVSLTATGDEYTVQVRGMDIYDPTKREIRSAGIDRIQAWFLDTNYDGERFIVRHAYFLGDDEVFEDLKRALKGEIDEEGWRSVYRDVSRPFPRPRTGKIAVKVITVYGDETIVVLKV